MKTKFPVISVFLFVWLLVMLLLMGCGSAQKPDHTEGEELQGTISVSGAFALYPLTVRWAEEFRKVYPKVRIDISAGGAGKGMADVLSGMVDLAMFSREITPPETGKGAWWIAVTRDAVLGTYNASNTYAEEIRKYGISKATLKSIYLDQTIKHWNQIPGIKGEEHPIIVYTRSDACGAAEIWGQFLGENQECLCGIGVFGDPGIADAVKSDKFGMGFNNVIYAYDINSRKKYEGLEIIPIDFNNNGLIDPHENFYETLDEISAAIADQRYPSPPARDLYFISKGKPEKHLIKVFLKWILEDGQQFVAEAGYVKFSDDKIEEQLEKLK